MKVSYSLTFTQRLRCKHCNGIPINFYFIANKKMILMGRRLPNYDGKIVYYNYKYLDPKDFTNISSFSHFSLSKCGTLYHRSHKDRKNSKVVVATCQCDKSMWYFTNPNGNLTPSRASKFYDKELKYLF